ncbi:MAG TPA: hypothetical protein H9906_05025 [Candidatus Paenalcaligenes intestinipullorum]|uniref:Uncharacterized protein n=1 Tax=Candidatus Paenalcaligenes intestinipullorum TaxID=2838718 RepID=A0A9D2RJU9_9BURK|nr:hypothetical protein [Candidatus Paenalcaligenes intestinipullorum]
MPTSHYLSLHAAVEAHKAEFTSVIRAGIQEALLAMNSEEIKAAFFSASDVASDLTSTQRAA